MLLKEIFYKRRNEKAWSLRLLPLVFLSCFVCSVQSFAQSSVIATEKDSFNIIVLKTFAEKGKEDKALILMYNIISRPNWEHDSDTLDFMKALIERGNSKILKRIVRAIPQSYLIKHPELLKAIIEKEDNSVLREIIGYISFDPLKKGHPDLVRALIANVNTSVAHGAQEVFMDIALVILVEPHWQANPDLKDYLIEQAGWHTSEKVKAFKNKMNKDKFRF